jgi:hypothetical protein
VSGGDIVIRLLNPLVKPGQESGIALEMKDCDGKPLADQEIAISARTFNGKNSAGEVRPAKVKTDASGKARAVFKAAAKATSGFLLAESEPVNVKYCKDEFRGYAPLFTVPSYEISIDYRKQGSLNAKMKTSDSIMTITMPAESSTYSVAYHTSIYHYDYPRKDKEYTVELKADEFKPDQFERFNNSETIMLDGYGSSRTFNVKSAAEITVHPLNASSKLTEDSAEVLYTDKPDLPQVIININNGKIEAFDLTVNFPLFDRATESGGFLAIDGNKDSQFIVSDVEDPKSPFKKEYLITFYKKLTDQGPMGSTGITESAVVRVLTRE